jgi:hypothetical protein
MLRWAGLQDVQAVDYHALRERDIERWPIWWKTTWTRLICANCAGQAIAWIHQDCAAGLARDGISGL